MKYTCIRQYEFDPELHAKGEINSGLSDTIQSQSMSVSDILVKFSQGVLPPIQFPVNWDDEPDFDATDPTLSGDFDLSDTDNIQDRINELQNSLTTSEEGVESNQTTQEDE